MSNAIISFPAIGLSVNPNPVLLSVFGWTFRWYGAIIACGFLLAIIYVLYRAKHFGLQEERVIDMLLCAVPAAIIFARLYYVVFNFQLYAENPINILKVWEGGLAIYGGVIGGALAVFIYCRAVKLPVGAMLDLCSLGLLIGQAVGRWGNFVNREVYGVATDLPWRMGLTNAAGKTIYVHPTFLYESLWNLLGFILLHFYSKKRRKYDGQLFILYIAWYGLGRFFIEGIRSDVLYLWGTNIRVSQLLAIVSFITALILLFRNRFLKQHDPDDMLVNRLRAENEKTALADGAELAGVDGGARDESDELWDDIEYEPVIEPIEVTFHDKDGGEAALQEKSGEDMEDGGNS